MRNVIEVAQREHGTWRGEAESTLCPRGGNTGGRIAGGSGPLGPRREGRHGRVLRVHGCAEALHVCDLWALLCVCEGRDEHDEGVSHVLRLGEPHFQSFLVSGARAGVCAVTKINVVFEHSALGSTP